MNGYLLLGHPYERDLKAIQSLVREKTDSNYRTEILQPQTGNDSMKYGYNGISQFSSVRKYGC